jgi:hypothetical protein
VVDGIFDSHILFDEWENWRRRKKFTGVKHFAMDCCVVVDIDEIAFVEKAYQHKIFF